MIVEVLNTGSELLLGDVTNTHLPRIAERLAPLGLRIARQTTVPDGAPIRDALAEAIGRCDLLIVTGGLGPTTDDVTREITSELLGLPLNLSEEVAATIRERLEKRGLEIRPRILRQAMIPQGATVLPNPHGTAPGLYLPPDESPWHSSPHLLLLPGPPRELLPMLDSTVVPMLKTLFPRASLHQRRTYHIVGMGESAVEQSVGLALSQRGDVEVGYCARQGEVDFRVIATRSVLDEIEPQILKATGQNLVSSEGRCLEDIVVSELARRHEWVSTAESCTGGMLAHKITNVSGASAVFGLGFVTYANEQKIHQLGVPQELLEREGAVSAAVAEAMASRMLAISGSDYALSLTGIAGPGGGSPQKPVGTVYIGLAEKDAPASAVQACFPVDRETFKHLASQKALDLLRRRLLDKDSNSQASIQHS